MACRTPVVAANRGALPEIYADAALMVDPEDAGALAAAAVAVASDGARRVEMMAAGLRLAAELTWDRAARATDALIDRLLGEGAAC
jgi:alpha-1,3-rhamnosyl/mannosyltransferase